MFILKVNLFHKPAIYVYLTFKLVLNAISPVSRLETIMIANSFEQLADQYCNIARKRTSGLGLIGHSILLNTLF